ncbi:MAG: hypothetical protein QM784_37225 [Polyangiaceae bacterium]
MTILDIQISRKALAQARTTLISAQYDLEAASNALVEARRVYAPGTAELSDAEAAKESASVALQQARETEATAKTALQVQLGAWLPEEMEPTADLARLKGNQPIVLFPVRIETRFDGNLLKVRVFPDEILQSTHETALTTEEYAAAENYYVQLNEHGKEPELWRDLIARFGVQRSAYLLRIMLPIFGGGGWGTTTSGSSDCCESITGGKNQALAFPTDVQLRSGSWTRPGEAVLPDRWVYITYRGGTKKIHTGKRILEPLACTLDPSASREQRSALESGEFYIDDNIRWTVDFSRAVDVGMGIEIPLTPTEATPITGGFDRVIVVGVKTSMSDVDTSAYLEKLFDAHHYTRGLAIVRQGTPTNNIEGQPTAYPPQENAGEVSFDIERKNPPLNRTTAPHCLPKDTDGYALARMLGLPSGVLSNVDRSHEKEIDRAHHMNRVLWPGTLGYFMRTMMDPVFKEADIDGAQGYFVDHVLARGPAPAFRVGATPYGVLPIASLKNWMLDSTGNSQHIKVETTLLKPLQELKEIWLDAVPLVPKVSETSEDPDGDLARIFALHPSARELRVRRGLGETVQWSAFSFFGWDFTPYWNRYSELTRQLFTRIGLPALQPRIGRTYFMEDAPQFTGAWVFGRPRENRTLDDYGANFIYGIATATPAELNHGDVSGKPSLGSALYSMLRHSTLAEYARIINNWASTTQKWQERELWWLPSFAELPTPIVWYFSQAAGINARAQATAHYASLMALQGASTAELERLLSETLDLTSHRIDAWITAYGYRRLLSQRNDQESQHMKFCGDYLGGYGIVENVRPRVKIPRTLPDGTAAELQTGNGGFVHTPSMTHAAAAAVLRSAHLSYRHIDPTRYAIDLSSRRVRAGRNLLDGVRNGQPMSSLLGYQFERGLHEGHPSVSGLDRIRFRFRQLFPLVAKKDGTDAAESAETIAARNVVDGEQLLRAYRANKINFLSDDILPDPGTAQHAAVQQEMQKLLDAYDGATDLVTAEAVFQFARGNVNAAVPVMQNAVRGKPLPDPAVVRSARGGLGIAHRVAWVLPTESAGADPLAALWPAITPRAAAEPVLDVWFGQLLGDPKDVQCAVDYLDASGVVLQSVAVSLFELGLRPLDVLALAQAVVQNDQRALLDRRVVMAATTKTPPADTSSYKVRYDATASRSFPQVIEVASAANAVLSSSRALNLSDLLSPAEVDEGIEAAEATALENSAELAARALAGKGKLTEAALAVTQAVAVAKGVSDPESLSVEERAVIIAALVETAWITVANAYPASNATGTELIEAILAAQKELARRSSEIPGDPSPNAAASVVVEAAVATLKAVFGSSFVVLPHVSPPRPQELGLSLGARGTLLNGQNEAPERYLQQLTRVRGRLARWRKFNLYTRALGARRPRLRGCTAALHTRGAVAGASARRR